MDFDIIKPGGDVGGTTLTLFGPNNVYYEKFTDHFMVYVFFKPRLNAGGVNNSNFPTANPRENRSLSMNGFTVFSKSFPNPAQNNGANILASLNALALAGLDEKNPYVTSCAYPTIAFEVIGFPSSSYYGRMAQDSTPTITLR